MFEPRWYQREAVEACWQHLCDRPGNPLIVLPTGAGKSLVIAMLCEQAVRQFNGRVIVLAHRKELLVQNAEKIKALLPDLDIGIYSAGLKSRDVEHDIVLAGIQSVHDKAHLFGRRHFVIPDEAHLIPSSGDGMYRTFLTELRKLNPNLRVAGLTATPFRTGDGKLCGNANIFQEICYSASVSRLISEGFLSNLITLPASASVDTSGLHVRSGEFVSSEMEALFNDEAKIFAACTEIVLKTAGRRSTLVFCPGIYHAEKTRAKIEELTGEECGIVTGSSGSLERASTLARFRDGSLKRLCNVDVLTTGFDAPGIDAIAVLRATMSPGLFAQICGRGLRTASQKENCLVLDFGENLKRHGPLDSESFGITLNSGRGKGNGDAPTKTCPACEEAVPISALVCECGWKFPAPSLAKHGTNPDGSPIFEADVVATRWTVLQVMMSRHKKKRAEGEVPDTLRVDYVCQKADSAGGDLSQTTISEWVCLEHEGFAKNKAALWWQARSLAPVPDISGAICLWSRGAVATPTFIETKPDGNFKKIVSCELDEKPESWAEELETVVVDGDFDAFDQGMEDVPF